MLDLAIIGSGPAGYTAGIYASRASLKPVLFEGLESGGQLMLTTDVENYPVFDSGIMGPDLMQIFKKQAEKFGTQIKTETVNKIEKIDTAKKKFDPNFHQAMLEIEDNTKDPGIVIQEIQKGYMMKDRLLRPSLVGVTKKREEKREKEEKKWLFYIVEH